MPFEIKKYASDLEQALNGPLKAWAWIAITILIVTCGGVIIFEKSVPSWVFHFAQVILIGASTTAFTRLLGGMGLFRDAIADVLGEDRWLDRRKDLDDLWRRITRRIFLPGFRENAPDAQKLMAALNETMDKLVYQPDKQVNYYQREMKRRIKIEWIDETARRVKITDRLITTIVPFDAEKGCQHEIRSRPTTGQTLNDYVILLENLAVDGVTQKVNPVVENNVHRFIIPLKGKDSFEFDRTLIFEQNLPQDPIYYVYAGRGVVWGLHAIIDPAPARSLRINFEEVGIEGAFRTIGDTPARGSQEWEAKGALLPNQGFQVIMIPDPAP
jgi:hypothetical protein